MWHPVVLQNCYFSLSIPPPQTSWTLSRVTWRIWRRWLQQRSSILSSATPWLTAAVEGQYDSVTWGNRRSATHTASVSTGNRNTQTNTHAHTPLRHGARCDSHVTICGGGNRFRKEGREGGKSSLCLGLDWTNLYPTTVNGMARTDNHKHHYGCLSVFSPSQDKECLKAPVCLWERQIICISLRRKWIMNTLTFKLEAWWCKMLNKYLPMEILWLLPKRHPIPYIVSYCWTESIFKFISA